MSFPCHYRSAFFSVVKTFSVLVAQSFLSTFSFKNISSNIIPREASNDGTEFDAAANCNTMEAKIRNVCAHYNANNGKSLGLIIITNHSADIESLELPNVLHI